MPLNSWLIWIDADDRTTLMAMDEDRRIVTHLLPVDRPTEPSDSANPPRLNPDVWATAIAQQLRSLGHLSDQPLTLALPSKWCYWANLSAQGLVGRKQRHQALTYRFEEQLPLAAEELVADFDIHHDHQVFAVGVSIQQVAPLAQALERQGLLLQAITSSAWLASQALGSESLSKLDLVLIDSPPTWELWLLQQGHPIGWYRSVQSETNGLIRSIRPLADLSGKTKLQARWIGQCQSPIPPELQSWLECPLDEPISLPSAMMKALAEHHQQNRSLGINLRRDTLAEPNPLRLVRRPLIAAVSSVLALLLILPIALGWRSHQYHRLAGQSQDSQQAIFIKQYPGQAVPINIASRLTSERQRWQVMTGGVSGGSETDAASLSAQMTLYQCLRRLPTDLKYRLIELRIDSDKVYIEGQTRSHSDAEILAAALRRAGASSPAKSGKPQAAGPGFVVQPPRSDQMADGTVAFSLVAHLPAASSNPRSEPKP